MISRKLLRRRHVRKEQLRKQREARGLLNMRETRGQRKRKEAREHGSNQRSTRGIVLAAAHSLPQLSPMILKSDSFSSVTPESQHVVKHSSRNETWTIEVGDSPKAKATTTTSDSVPVTLIAFPRNAVGRSTSMTRVSFSPLRSRSSSM